MWDRLVAGSRFTSLSYANLHDYLVSIEASVLFVALGSTQGAQYIVCNIDIVATWVTKFVAEQGGNPDDDDDGPSTITCVCMRDDCCSPNNTDCINFDPDSEFDDDLEPENGDDPGLEARALPISPTKDRPTHMLKKRGKAHTYVRVLMDYSVNPPATIPYEWTAPSVCSPPKPRARLFFLLVFPTLSSPFWLRMGKIWDCC